METSGCSSFHFLNIYLLQLFGAVLFFCTESLKTDLEGLPSAIEKVEPEAKENKEININQSPLVSDKSCESKSNGATQ